MGHAYTHYKFPLCEEPSYLDERIRVPHDITCQGCVDKFLQVQNELRGRLKLVYEAIQNGD